MSDIELKDCVLVTGGAGYIGSHVVLALLDADMPVVIIDDLSTGLRKLLPRDVPFFEGNVSNSPLVRDILQKFGCRSVMHFAGSIVVEESISDPIKYYQNNVVASLELIQACLEESVHEFIFSSTAAVYGTARSLPVREDADLNPINPYGASKLAVEGILRDVSASSTMRYAALRYFNVAGADPNGRSGQISRNSTHLLKVACEAALGERDGMKIFGEDYDTSDGTCVRDYIHVSDLADAHIETLHNLRQHQQNLILNCGYGHGTTVRQMIDKVIEVAGTRFKVASEGRRPGDPAELFADTNMIRNSLNWTPKYDDLDVLVKTAFDWERRYKSHPELAREA